MDERGVSLPRPPDILVEEIRRAFQDALDFDHAVISGLSGDSVSKRVDSLKKTLHIGDFSYWTQGSIKVDNRPGRQ